MVCKLKLDLCLRSQTTCTVPEYFKRVVNMLLWLLLIFTKTYILICDKERVQVKLHIYKADIYILVLLLY